MNLLRRLFSRCDHAWETLRETRMGYPDKWYPNRFHITHVKYTLRCKKCGDVTTRNA